MDQTDEIVSASDTLLEEIDPKTVYYSIIITQPHPKKLTAERGAKTVQFTNVEKGVSTATRTCFSANEDFIKLFVIFKGKKSKSEFCVAMPPVELVEVSETGCISSELLPSCFTTFIYTDLRLLDGHGCHVNDEVAHSLADALNIHLLCFPPRTAHFLQPLNRSFFKPLKYAYNHDFYTRVRYYSGADTKKLVLANCCEKRGCAVTVNIGNNGFREFGIFPVNKHAIPELATPPPSEALSTEADRTTSSPATPDRISVLSLSAGTTSRQVDDNEYRSRSDYQQSCNT
jgi:hypothetical protein